MKKTRILCICCIGIVLAAIFVAAGIWFTKSDLEKIVITQGYIYNEKWKFDHIEENDEEKIITIEFKKKQGYWNDNFESIYDIYQWLYSQLYEDNMLNEYLLNIDFFHIGECFSIHNITADLNNVEITCSSWIELEKISDKFPEAAALGLFPAIYSDISEFEDFYDLRYICFGNQLTDSEILCLKSYFPDCKLEFLYNSDF